MKLLFTEDTAIKKGEVVDLAELIRLHIAFPLPDQTPLRKAVEPKKDRTMVSR